MFTAFLDDFVLLKQSVPLAIHYVRYPTFINPAMLFAKHEYGFSYKPNFKNILRGIGTKSNSAKMIRFHFLSSSHYI